MAPNMLRIKGLAERFPEVLIAQASITESNPILADALPILTVAELLSERIRTRSARIGIIGHGYAAAT